MNGLPNITTYKDEESNYYAENRQLKETKNIQKNSEKIF